MSAYQARLCEALSSGERRADILVIDPVESRASVYSWLNDGRSEKITSVYEKCLKKLLKCHFDYEIGSEEIISRHGSAENGLFRVGKAKYRAVVVPKIITLRNTTLALLRQFAEQGGEIFMLGGPPGRIDGAPGKFDLKAAYTNLDCLSNDLTRRGYDFVSVSSENVYYHLRSAGGGYILFLANNGGKTDASVRVKGRFEIISEDILTGTRERLAASESDGATEFKYEFPKYGSLLLRLREGEPAPSEPKRAETEAVSIDG
jgi:hypothetical protein